jgi:hypothetical protein
MSGISAEKSLKLTIRLEQSQYCLGDPVIAIVTMTNIGNKTLLINARMALHKPGLPSPIRELAFNITAPDGKSYDPILYASPKLLEKKDFIEIKPGSAIEFEFHFASNFYIFPEVGIYRIVANYQNIIDPNNIDSTDKRIAWKGELNSNEILLTIVPCSTPSTMP